MENTCIVCHTTFTNRNAYLYCSGACKTRAYALRKSGKQPGLGQQATCLRCDAAFSGTAGMAYCSDACRLAEQRADGRNCRRCGRPLIGSPKQVLCGNTCRIYEYRSRRMAGRSGERHLKSCPVCGKEFAGYTDKVYCSVACRDRHDAQQNTAKSNARYRTDPEYREKRRRSGQEAKAKAKLRAFEAYGGARCVCCGETGMVFLTIDHIDGGGNEHRRTIGNGRLSVWLRKQGFPLGYQVLCFNCNYAKWYCGVCPHQPVVSP